jgi:hypothetical protein
MSQDVLNELLMSNVDGNNFAGSENPHLLATFGPTKFLGNSNIPVLTSRFNV